MVLDAKDGTPLGPARLEDIRARTRALVAELPAGVELLLAAKTRTPEELRAALEVLAAHGRTPLVGHNYVQEAERSRKGLRAPGPGAEPPGTRWHLIGHLQRNKAAKAAALFDQVESLDSPRLADALEAALAGISLPGRERRLEVLIEINSAGEAQKDGASPDDAPALARHVRERCPHLALVGLMTMGPFVDDPEAIRPSFRLTRRLRDELRASGLPGLDTLSMGMSGSWRAAVEEGATRVRVGSLLFGPR
jgi:hypothetical protein